MMDNEDQLEEAIYFGASRIKEELSKLKILMGKNEAKYLGIILDEKLGFY